ncbi:hypothetical protein C5C18_12930 [Rathayibacter tritici]|uniref:N-acetyltransferase domain-containing protein n=1 Tax=Rathayibacter tritici TaxID=33888 RepID=A0A160KPG9_9MICO|nr:hypothetical protein [Rathayibacter tritici]AND15336.1 hypothetical protein A6122_0171 [Rathayibacter tritici]PPF27964.1 hypothetical protein C5C06_08675 [Rathayibacter tritici]PPF65217.1 hypothetical protein C5C21_11105 [Rathayibacter tritici]PPG04823.1 hypothetical protein C5C18_12930 [Rathayibacter tritici]PPI18981.1 hypothetical protein C5D07_02670 [Rathayibacter tritici]
MTGPEPGSDQRTASIDHHPENLRLLPWSQADAAILRDTLAQANGELESESEILVRHDRYLRGWADGDAFFYVVELNGVSVGSIGYWYGSSRGVLAYEAAWNIVPHARGVTVNSVRLLLEEAAEHPVPRFVHAFVAQGDLDASATCVEAGFDRVDLVEQGDPPALYVDWAFDLAAVG